MYELTGVREYDGHLLRKSRGLPEEMQYHKPVFVTIMRWRFHGKDERREEKRNEKAGFDMREIDRGGNLNDFMEKTGELITLFAGQGIRSRFLVS